MNQYMGKVLKAWMMLLAMSFALAGTATLSSCSSDDDPYFTVSEDDDPRILNTDLVADSKIDRKTNYKLEIKVTPVHYTTVTWLLDGTKIAEGNTIDQTLPLGDHELKIVATTTKNKSTSRTLKVTVTPAADDPAFGTNAIELWVAPGEETTIHNCKNLGTVTKVMVGGKEVAFEILEEGTAMKLTAPADLENGDYAITLVDGDGVEFPGGTIKVTSEPKPSTENVLWEGEFAVTWGTPFEALKETFLSKVKAGTILRVYVDGKGQGTATTASWNNILTGKGGDIERGDIMVDGPAKWEFKLTDLSIQLLKEQWGLILVGNGYTVKKVTIE
nr:hypothetical protein [uncultured Prevotella sp.]